ncbi:unnamed protein product [Microthlaspi erraticum]|uniref:Histone deacetylase interacting domain-containing protein n=1 Tax=Microthlaspi erraticum TaxID=1685480 RepID=A0A6D2JL58_9BRAS|nr:unnamed protein product [Microthlaspi erraticum]
MAYDEEELRKIITVAKIMDEKLSPSEKRKLMSLIEDFVDKRRISHTEFSKSFHLLLAGKVQKDEDRKTQQNHRLLGEPKIHQTKPNHLAVGADVDGNLKKQSRPKIRIKLVFSDKRVLEKRVTDALNLEGKKRRVLLQTDPSHERPVKRTRTSKRLGRVTRSYKLIPEEEQEQSPVKDTVLNNKCRLMRFPGPSGNHKKVIDYEEAMARCEDEMFETDMLMESLKSAVEKAERVISGEMVMEDLGVKFYRCIEMMYGGDMSEIVREDHNKALPVILRRLKEKLSKLTAAKEKWKSGWKRVFEVNTAKQRVEEKKAQLNHIIG